MQQSNTNIVRRTSSAKTTHSVWERERHLNLTLFHFIFWMPLLGHKALHLPKSIPQSIPISTSLKVTSDKDGLSWEPRIPQDNPSQTKDWDMLAFFFLRGTNSAGLLGTAVWLSKFALFKALERHDLSRCVFALSVQSLVSLSWLSSDCYKNVSVITQALIGMQQLSKTVFAE